MTKELDFAMPLDLYDPAWVEWNRAHPDLPKSLGAAAADEGGDGDGEDGSGDGADGGEDESGAGDGDAGGKGGQDDTGSDAGGDDGGQGSGDEITDDDVKAALEYVREAKASGIDLSKFELPGGGDWREGITDEQERRYAERFDSPAAMAREALKMRKKTSTAIVKPGKDATDEEVAAYRKAMGVPDKAEEYKITVPDDLPEHLKPSESGEGNLDSFREAAHTYGLSQAQFDGAVEWFYGRLKDADTEFEKASETAREKSEAQLRKEWGNEYKANSEMAYRAAEHFGGQDFKAMIETVTLDGVHLGDHPTFLKTFSQVGRLLKEADPLHGMSDEEKDTLEEQHKDATEKMWAAHDKGDREGAERWQKRRTAISEKIAGVKAA